MIKQVLIGFPILVLTVMGAVYFPLFVLVLSLLALVLSASMMVGLAVSEVFYWIRNE